MNIGRIALLASLAVITSCAPPDTTESPEESPKRPSDWHFVQRTYPFYTAEKSSYHDALDQVNRMASGKRSLHGPWIPVGPVNIGGRIVDIEFDPLRPDTIYAGAATGGVFKSTDNGSSWNPVFDQQGILTIGDLAVDPQNSDILYAGTGEANGGHNNFAGGGLYKSTDAGLTWNYSGLLETTSIGRVLVDPQDPNILFVAAAGSYFETDSDRGLYRSSDGGASWEKVLFVNDSTGVIDVVQKPDDPSVLLAASWERVRRPDGPIYLHGNGSGIYRSADGGDSWSLLGPSEGLPLPVKDATNRDQIGRIGLAFSNSNPNIAYALYTDGNNYLGLFRSFDGGLSWSNADPNNQLAGISGGFSWYFGQIRIHPTDPSKIYVMDVLLASTVDAATSWSFDAGTHVDHHALAFDPRDPDRVVNGNDGGIGISNSGGSSWIPAANLPVTQFYEIAFDPSNPNRRGGGTQDNGSVISDGDTDWNFVLGGDGFYVIFDPNNQNTIYAEMQNGVLLKSVNGGTSWSSAVSGIPSGEKRNWSTPVVMDPGDSQVLYYGTSKVYKTVDGAASWTAISPNLGRPESQRLGTITTMAVAPTDTNVLYAGTDDGKVWVTTTGGSSWTDVTNGLPNRWVTRIAVSPWDPGTAYVTFSGLKWRDSQPHIFRTTDGGTSWTDISANLPDLPVNALALDEGNRNVIYIGTDIGAFVTEDDGQSWSTLGEGLPSVPVYDLKYIAETRELLAGTYGRSAYTLDVSALSVSTEDQDPGIAEVNLGIYPNPFRSSVTIQLPDDRTALSVSVYDILGRLVWKKEGITSQQINISSSELSGSIGASGVYLVRVSRSGSPNHVIAEGSVLHVR